MPVPKPKKIDFADLDKYIGKKVMIKIKDAIPFTHVVGTLDEFDNKPDIVVLDATNSEGETYKKLIVFHHVIDYVEEKF